ncbi:MAG: FKBP-type peptidyl-prolyl cis-trans isomerase [Terrimicrobiaceae bacterium]
MRIRSFILATTLIPLTIMAQTALEKGEAFLKQNATKEGVETTASGLQYKVLTEGTGKIPKATDTVTVNYRGTLIDGTEFDSSYKRGEPISFPLNGVIPGWTEGVQLMKEGAKYQFTIPSKLAYGSRGAGGVIGPDETLIFEVELLKVK